MDLNLLWTLHVVLQEGSVTAAAARLNLTSPAVSNALARLRNALGDPLFVRAGRGLVPTSRAMELRPALASTFEALERALSQGEGFNPKTLVREFTIALSDTEQVTCMPAIASLFAAELPLSSIHVVSIDTLLAGGGLSASAADLTISPPLDAPGIRQRHLYDEHAAFIVRTGHPLLDAPMTPEAFNAARHIDVHIALGRGGVGNDQATDAIANQGFAREVALRVPGFVPAVMIAASTDLVAGVPRRLADTLAAHFPIAMLSGRLPTLSFEMMLTWHERTDADPGAAFLRELVVRATTRRAGRALATFA
ncbi:MAG TPA: LysR family transcriptional regulator [Myxococcota bacterium]|nr:LysR family transcriptional regulator [Myxococcota bacterium]